MRTSQAKKQILKAVPQSAPPPEDLRQPLVNHLSDLRNLIFKALGAVAMALCFTYNYCDVFIELLQRPLLKHFPPDQQFLYFTGITDKFVVYLQVSVVAALFLTVPIHLYLLWQFIKPGLHLSERKLVVPFLFMGTFSFVVGLCFGYFLVVPFGYEFLIGFGSTAQKPMITVKEYFPLTLKILGVVGLVFELPVVLMLLGVFGLITPDLLAKYRRHAFLALTAGAAILTPSPDAFTMILVAIPMCLLYEISIWGVLLIHKRKAKASESSA